MDEIKQIADILYTNAEMIKNVIAIMATGGSLLVAGWKVLIYELPLYLSSSIEIALMSKQEQWKYSCVNIVILAVGIWIMNLGIGWLSRTEKTKEIFAYMLLFSLLELCILLIVSIGKWGCEKIKKWHIERFGAALKNALRGKIKITRKSNQEKKNNRIWEKVIKFVKNRNDDVFNFYSWLVLGLLLFNIAVSGALTYEGIKQRLLTSAILTCITIEIIVGTISAKKKRKSASIVFFSPENHKNIYIYLKNDQGNYICGNNMIMEECTEYYVIPQEHILERKLKLLDKEKNQSQR